MIMTFLKKYSDEWAFVIGVFSLIPIEHFTDIEPEGWFFVVAINVFILIRFFEYLKGKGKC